MAASVTVADEQVREGWPRRLSRYCLRHRGTLTTAVLAVGVVCTLLFAERTAGRSLEDITGAVAVRQAAKAERRA